MSAAAAIAVIGVADVAAFGETGPVAAAAILLLGGQRLALAVARGLLS